MTSRFNEKITMALKEGATQAFLDHGGSLNQIDHFEVPGAFELPILAKKLAKTKQYDAILCLGAIIRGETAHFDMVANSCLMGLTQVSIETEVPILNGVITANTEAQAKERSSKELNLGYEYMKSTLEMIETCQAVDANFFANNSSI